MRKIELQDDEFGSDVDLRSADVLLRLKGQQTYITLDPRDPLFPYGVNEVHKAYTAATIELVRVKGGEALYLPKYPKDYVDHPAAYRAMNVACFLPHEGGRLTQVELPTRKLFFFIPRKAVKAILEGRMTAEDIEGELWDTRPV